MNVAATFEDLGLRLVPAEAQHAWVLESETGLLQRLARRDGPRVRHSGSGSSTLRVLTYLANTIRIGEREVPYSVVAGVDPRWSTSRPYEVPPLAKLQPHTAAAPGRTSQTAHPPIWLNAWAATDLQAKSGDEVTLEYYLWSDESGLRTSSATFTYVGSVPMDGAGGDRTLTPEYPGPYGRPAYRRLGPAVPRRSRADPPRRRSVLGEVPHGAQGIHHQRGGPLALPVRHDDVAAHLCAQGNAA